MTDHPQVAVHAPWTPDEILVDEGMVPLLRALWGLGYRTTHSCENNESHVYISFTEAIDGFDFLVEVARVIGFDDYYVHAGRYELSLGTEGRSCVRFNRYSEGVNEGEGVDMLTVTTAIFADRVPDENQE